MDPLLNPYRPGAGAPPPILAGREDEFAAIATMLGRLQEGRGERSIVLTGLRADDQLEFPGVRLGQNAVLVSGDSDLLDLADSAPICSPADFPPATA